MKAGRRCGAAKAGRRSGAAKRPGVHTCRVRTRLLLAAAAVFLGGCYGSTGPTYNPAETSTLVQDITRRAVTITATVSGDSACADPSLTDNALHLTVRDPAGGQSRDIYIYRFNPKTWDASKVTVDACQQAYTQARPGAQIVRLDIPVYRVLGADWSAQLNSLITAAVTEASQSGDPNAGAPE